MPLTQAEKETSEHDTFLELLIPEEAIQQRIEEVARQINTDYRGREVTIVTIMKGAVCLLADLIRKLAVPSRIEFIRASGVGGGNGEPLHISGLDQLEVQGRHVLAIDAIYDSGNTLSRVRTRLFEMRPDSLRTLVLMSKRVPRQIPHQPDYVLFEIEDRFVVGYGLDYREHFRGLRGVYALLLENFSMIQYR